MISPGDKTALCAQIRRLFWDKPLEEADIEQYPLWIMGRVLDYGDLPDVLHGAFRGKLGGGGVGTDRGRGLAGIHDGKNNPDKTNGEAQFRQPACC